jgi:uncharacterized protein YggE
MDIERKELHIVPPKRIEQFGVFALTMLGVFLLVAAIAQLEGLRYIGTGVAATNTLAVSGEGDIFAVPDTATFTFGVDETAADVATAQSKATTEANAVIDYLKAQGIADTDIQTTDYNINPQYSYSQSVCPTPASSGVPIYCPPGRQTLTGYEVTQTVSVEVRDTSKAGTILAGVGSKGATNVSGLSLTVSNQDALDAQARDKAIQDAKAKAEVLAKSLGVTLVRVVGYSDNSGGPVYYPKAMALDSAAGSAAAPAPAIPTGQNKITSDVTVTYEIR